MTEANRQLLEQIFREVFDDLKDGDVTSLSQLNTPRWDSLAHVTLVTAIESEFSITIDTEESMEMTSYPAAELLLTERGL